MLGDLVVADPVETFRVNFPAHLVFVGHLNPPVGDAPLVKRARSCACGIIAPFSGAIYSE
jgi:hypothetical protein